MARVDRQEKSIALADFYHSLWRALLITLAILVIATQTARFYVVIPFFTVAFVLMTPLAYQFKIRRNRIIFGLYPCIAAAGASRIFDFNGLEELPAVMIEVVSGFLPILLADSENPRRFWLAILNACVIAIGCVTFSSSLMVYAFFLVFIGILIVTLNVGNLYLRDSVGVRPTTSITRDYFWQFGHVMPVGILGAGIIFFSFPRVQTFTNALDFGIRSRTGYSGLISLAESSSIELSQELAFIATSKDRNWLQTHGPRLLFRGDSLDSFDGAVWKSTVFDYKSRETNFDYRVATQHSQDITSLTILMEPNHTSTIFYPDILVDAQPQSQFMGDFLFNANGSVIRTTYSGSRFSYLVRFMRSISETSLPGESIDSLKKLTNNRLSTANLPHQLTNKEFQLYTEIPQSISEADWFLQWISQISIDTSRDTIRSLSGKISGYFQANFKASLRNPMRSENTLKDFLTNTREGHCEYFATAAALFWRNLGIPTRVVVGYHGGEFNPVIDALEVRESQAHAWIEIFLPDLGWYQLDPTPSMPSASTGSILVILRMYANAAAFFLRSYVVDYNHQTQQGLLHLIQNASKNRGGSAPWTDPKKFLHWQYWVLLTAVAGLIYVIIRRLRKYRNLTQLPQFYIDFERKIALRGLTRQTGETFLAFHQRCIEQGLDKNLVQQVNLALEQTIYAERSLPPSEEHEIQQALLIF